MVVMVMTKALLGVDTFIRGSSGISFYRSPL